jgi:hypothetical protein
MTSAWFQPSLFEERGAKLSTGSLFGFAASLRDDVSFWLTDFKAGEDETPVAPK